MSDRSGVATGQSPELVDMVDGIHGVFTTVGSIGGRPGSCGKKATAGILGVVGLVAPIACYYFAYNSLPENFAGYLLYLGGYGIPLSGTFALGVKKYYDPIINWICPCYKQNLYMKIQTKLNSRVTTPYVLSDVETMCLHAVAWTNNLPPFDASTLTEILSAARINPRYIPRLFDKSFYEAMQSGVYAGNPHYAAMCMAILTYLRDEKSKLDRLNSMGATPPQVNVEMAQQGSSPPTSPPQSMLTQYTTAAAAAAATPEAKTPSQPAATIPDRITDINQAWWANLTQEKRDQLRQLTLKRKRQVQGSLLPRH